MGLWTEGLGVTERLNCKYHKGIDYFKLGVDRASLFLVMCAPLMGQQLRKRLKRQRRDARNKRVQARLRAGMKK